MTPSSINEKKRHLSWRISLVYTIPMLVFTIVLVVVFSNFLKSTLITSSYSSSESKFQDKVVIDLELFFDKFEKQFKPLPKILQHTKESDIKKVLIIGSGPIVIGQACEFDYSGFIFLLLMLLLILLFFFIFFSIIGYFLELQS